MSKVIPTKTQLEEAYQRLQSLRKVGLEFSYTGEGIRHLMKKYGLNIQSATGDRYTCDNDFFARDNEASFYVAGFLAADGCVKQRKGRTDTSVVCLALSERDASHLQTIRSLMKVENPIHSKIVKNSLRNHAWEDSHEVELMFSSRKMCEDLTRFNIVPRKTHIYTFPEWLVNHRLVNHYMRGYSDRDGSFFTNKGVNVPQVYFNLRGTSEFLQSYRSVLERECNLRKREKEIRINSGIGVLEYGGNGIVKNIAKFLYTGASVCLTRKRQVVFE